LPTLVALGLLLGAASAANAQSALAATQPDSSRLLAPARLTLRPEPALRELSAQVAEVLELRGAAAVAVGEPPPPGLPEAVPAGHVAMLRCADRLQLVIGVSGGRSIEATVQFTSDGALPDPRSLALAVESLEDAATEQARAAPQGETAPGLAAEPEPPLLEDGSSVEAFDAQAGPPRDRGADAADAAEASTDGIQALIHARSYVGGSPASTGAVLGLATGVGLCAIGYCLVIQGEFPVNGDNTSPHDVRYRYMTFGAGLHAQPLRFGRLLPAANLLLITRMGHFGRDMGMPTADSGQGLDTDLGARASLELGVELFNRFDGLFETGVDLTIDGWQVNGGGSTLERGERAVPWVQAGVRYRPY
jgi:hypothetical protein